MIRLVQHGPVTQVECSSVRSRAIGFGVNAFLYRGLLIDTAFPGLRREFDAFLASQAIAGAVLTHHHEDHSGNLDLLIARGIPVDAAAETLLEVRKPGGLPFYRLWTWGRRRVPTGDPISFQAPGLELIPTPGHSEDHQAVWDAAEGVVFAGDLFLGVKTRMVNAWETPRKTVPSLRRVIALAPRILFDSHRGVIDKPVEALRAKADWLEETIGAIDRLIAAGLPDRAIRDRVLGKEGPPAVLSRGELSKLALVRALRRTA
ncbi:MAG: MBL fold metallo-hydrolase [Gemmatimonadota bacterium]